MLPVDTPDLLPRFARITIDKVFDEQGNRLTCPQGRHFEREYV